MIRRQAILLDGDAGGDAGGGGGGAPADFLATLPEALRSEPSLASFKDPGTLAKSYVEAQKLVGTKRLPAPDDGWTDEQWGGLYKELGRPDTPEDYKLPEVKFEEGVDWDEKALGEAKKAMHSLGLNQKQVSGLLELQAGMLNNAAKSHTDGLATGKAQTEAVLRQEWGDDYDANVDLARGALNQFGGEEFVVFLEQSGLDNHPAMVKAMHSVAQGMLEDNARGKGGDVLKLSNATNANQEIARLKMDNDFMKAFTTAAHPGHQGAVDRMQALMRVAYPPEKTR